MLAGLLKAARDWSGDDVGPLACSGQRVTGVCVIAPGHHLVDLPGTDTDDAGNLPTSHKRIERTADAGGESLAPSDRKLVHKGG